MKRLLVLLLCCAALTLPVRAQNASRPQTKPLSLSQEGKTTYVIALAKDAIPAEVTAAKQLQKYLQEVTGASFPLRSENEVLAKAPQILVGTTERTQSLLPQQDWKALGQDGIVIKTVSNTLILAGGQPRGTLYAVFEFLEKSAGCRWWTSNDKAIPKRPTLSIPAQSTVYVPPFAYREHFTAVVREEGGEFATIMRENGHFQQQSPDWGGHYSVLGWCHTFSQLLPPDKYFKDHPEWYPDAARGGLPGTATSAMPHKDETHLCLSNPEVVEEISKQALIWIRKNPKAGYISISQNDSAYNFCTCPQCAQSTKEEGSVAGPLVKFVNAVAANIGKEYPDFLVETLAYQTTEKAPLHARPAKNVLMRFAPIESNFGYPLTHQENKSVRENLQSWAKISHQLFVWNYVTNFYYSWLPHPNWSGLGPDLRFFAANKVTGLFEQGDTYSQSVGDFIQLRAWLVGKLMWNPQQDQKKLTVEFLNGYYGAAGPLLNQYLNLIQSSFEQNTFNLRQDNKNLSYLTLETMNEATRLFNRAEAAVKDDATLLGRVQRERLALDLAWVYRYEKLKPEATQANKEFLGPADPLLAIDVIARDAEKFGDNLFAPGGAFPKVLPDLKDQFAPPVPTPDFLKDKPASDIIDVQQRDFYLYRRGELTDIVGDAAASDGKAVSLAGDNAAWAAQATLNRFLEDTENRTWHVYAYVRVATKENAALTGDGLQMGVYDKERKSLAEFPVALDKLTGTEYHRIDLGVHIVDGNTYVWFAPTLNPAVEKIFIDRVLFVREDK
jgi:hypothetical protein